MIPIGSRVGAIQKCDDKTVYFYGYGVYEGDFVPPVGPLGYTKEEYAEIAREVLGKDPPPYTNPRIRLDGGKAVWGFECWWGPEEEFKTMIGVRNVVIVEPEIGE